MSDPKAPAQITNEQLDWLLGAAQDIRDSLRTLVELSRQRSYARGSVEIDLEAPVNDPAVKLEPTKGPNKWTGESMKGRRLSECPADFLDRLALMFQTMADNPKEGKEKFRSSNLLDAARARAWAKRNRANGSPASVPENLDSVT